ncbi:MAG: CvpA family protein [Dehalococcoidia bacterium]
MNWLDLVILLILAWFTVAGATAGLPRELVTLVAMVLGVVLAGLFYERLATDLEIIVDGERAAHVLAFAAIFFAVYGAGQILTVLFRDVALGLTFGPLDRSGGLLIGLLKGVILVEAMLFIFALYHFETMVNAMDGSLLTPLFMDGIPFILPLLPGEFRSAVEAFPTPV